MERGPFVIQSTHVVEFPPGNRLFQGSIQVLLRLKPMHLPVAIVLAPHLKGDKVVMNAEEIFFQKIWKTSENF